MAANSNVLLSRLCEQLVSVYGTTLARRKHHERVVRDCRELLKPWPRKKPGRDVSEESSKGRPQAELPAPEIPVVPEAERAALELAEKALVTAHRLRQKQAKVIEREASLIEKEQLSNGTRTEPEEKTKEKESNDLQTLPKSTQKEIVASSKAAARGSSVGLKSGSAGNRTTQQARLSHSQQGEGQKSVQGQQRSSQGQSGSTQGQPRSAGRGDHGRFTKTKAQVSKPGSGKQQTVGVISQSTLKKVLKTAASGINTGQRPVHLSAPFKTELSASRVKHRPTRTSALRQTQSTAPQGEALSSQVRQGSNHSNRTMSSSGDHRISLSQHGCHSAQMDRGSVSEVTGQQGIATREMESPSADQPQQATLGKHVVDEMVDGPTTPISVQNQLDGAFDGDSSPEPALFELLLDGHTLTIPGRLRKAMSINNKLRQQVHTATLTVPASRQHNAATSFLNKLSDHYEATTPQPFRDAVHMLALYKRLAAVMDTLHKEKPNDATCDWRHVIRTKRLMENVCLWYADLEEDYTRLVHGSKVDSVPPEPALSVSHVCPAPLWLGDHIAAESKLQLQPVLRYKRQRDAELYVKLVHEFQLLQLKLYLMDLTAESLLPILQNEHTDRRSFNSLYRATYSLLCMDTQRRPVIIGDAVDDEVDS